MVGPTFLLTGSSIETLRHPTGSFSLAIYTWQISAALPRQAAVSLLC